MDTITLIVNPAAGRRRTERLTTATQQVLQTRVRHLRICRTQAPDDAVALAQRHAADSDLVVSVGGDGTLSHVLAGLLQAATVSPPGRASPPLAVLPAGTGNDFAAAIGVSADPMVAVQQLLRGTALPIDYGRLIPTKVPFLNIVGCGFDARIAAWLNRGRRLLPGKAAYIQGVVRELVALRSTPACLEVDGQHLEGDFLLVAIANAQSYGGGMRIAPQAQLTDGLFDVVAVDRVSRARFARCFPLVFTGRHIGLPDVHLLRGAHVRLETAEPAPILVDGDVRAWTPIEARIEPGGIRFWLPPGSPVLRESRPGNAEQPAPLTLPSPLGRG